MALRRLVAGRALDFEQELCSIDRKGKGKDKDRGSGGRAGEEIYKIALLGSSTPWAGGPVNYVYASNGLL